ncbi:VanZ family protein [Halorubrum sp. DTA46]|uniref:VanZ family protein n=1 Tax=Halorubrum sp. DTA46 TaxID=3402162 RepID=UPI003AAED700
MTRGRTDGRTLRGARTRAAAFAFLLLIASVVPVPGRGSGTGGAGIDLPLGIGLTDPFHLVGYAVLAALLAGATQRRRFGILLAVLVAVAVGFGIELVQSTVPWRSFAWRDVGINAIGATIGGAVSLARRVREISRQADTSQRRR